MIRNFGNLFSDPGNQPGIVHSSGAGDLAAHFWRPNSGRHVSTASCENRVHQQIIRRGLRYNHRHKWITVQRTHGKDGHRVHQEVREEVDRVRHAHAGPRLRSALDCPPVTRRARRRHGRDDGSQRDDRREFAACPVRVAAGWTGPGADKLIPSTSCASWFVFVAFLASCPAGEAATTRSSVTHAVLECRTLGVLMDPARKTG